MLITFSVKCLKSKSDFSNFTMKKTKYMQPFIHLHVHSQYSMLDGQASVSALVDKAMADGMRGIALTDHGNMFGIKEFHDYVSKKNSNVSKEIKTLKSQLKEEQGKTDCDNSRIEELQNQIKEAETELFIPIFGCEMYVAEKDMHEHVDKRDIGRHLVVLAKNSIGYHNLVKLVSKSWTEGFYQHPRTDKSELEKHKEGLIICSACLGGEVPKLISAGRLNEAKETIAWFKRVFGDDYYLELQRHKATVARANQTVYPAQIIVNEKLIEYAKEFDIKLICTNDVHFVNESDAEAHDRLICVSTNKLVADDERMFYSKQEWLKTQEEMNELFSDVPESLSNTLEILDKIEIYSINHDPILPNFPLPEGFNDNDEYLKYLVYEGAKRRWSEINDSIRERIDFELETIKNMGFPGYFLIVQDFINESRKLGVSVGPGRGSAAGSAVAYCLGITQIDPIKYDLLFERFLNPDRISLPDIDVDFDDDGRAKALKYVTDKYGQTHVAHIITYGSMAAKMAIKDVARVENLPLSESNRLAKMIPDRDSDMPVDPVKKKNYKVSISNCVKYLPEFTAEANNPDPLVAETIKYASALEGTVRNSGVHACGIIICRDDITDWVPVSTADDKKSKMKVCVTQYDGHVIESTGLIKMDFLGLKTLSIIKEALVNIKHNHGIDIDIDNIPIDDKKTYQLYCEGKTTGTFQFESAGMQKYLSELHPSTFEDLIAMNALYRPGPMDYIPDFIDRKLGKKPIEYDIDVMEQYLKETYGITVYQEQVMLLSRLLAGFTRGESDTLRKAMGKKMIDKMNELKGKFQKGGQERGYKLEVLNKIWADWEKFASYAFNKSHATCYSWVAYQTAYLKAHYPAEYMAAVLSRNLLDQKQLTKYMDECKSMKLEVKGPDVNESFSGFSATKKGDLRFGLAGLKGVGANAVEQIINEREANGPYKSIFNFIERVDLSVINRRLLENFALSGAFDCFTEISREDWLEPNVKGETFAELLVKYGQRYQESKNTQTISLFGDDAPIMMVTPEIPKAVKWNNLEKLEKEKELVGMYLSGHPLDPYKLELEYGCSLQLKDLKDFTELDKEVTFGGLVTKYEEKLTKKGDKFAIVTIEDFTGTYDIRLFSNDFVKFHNYGSVGLIVYITAKNEKSRYRDGVIDFKIQKIELLENLKGKMFQSISLEVENKQINKLFSSFLKNSTVASTSNKCSFFLTVKDETTGNVVKLQSKLMMPLTKEFIEYCESEEIKYKIN